MYVHETTVTFQSMEATSVRLEIVCGILRSCGPFCDSRRVPPLNATGNGDVIDIDLMAGSVHRLVIIFGTESCVCE
jgi:hypothetical protein